MYSAALNYALINEFFQKKKTLKMKVKNTNNSSADAWIKHSYKCLPLLTYA